MSHQDDAGPFGYAPRLPACDRAERALSRADLERDLLARSIADRAAVGDPIPDEWRTEYPLLVACDDYARGVFHQAADRANDERGQ